MVNEFIAGSEVWNVLTASTKRAKTPALVAVAYFGQGADRLLPLPEGSSLVVNASEAAVRAGQTCPAALKKLYDRGVNVYSAQDLHAKVYAFRSDALIGSANASANSAQLLNEAVLWTNDQITVRAAKAFVRGLCHAELGPNALAKLQKMYRPPHVANGSKKGRKSSAAARTPVFRIVTLKDISPPEQSESVREQGEREAEKRKRFKAHFVFWFWWPGSCSFIDGDTVLIIDEMPDGSRLVNRPGRVIKIWNGKPRTSFVFVEQAPGRRVNQIIFAKKLGYGAKRRLNRDGRVGDKHFIEAVWEFWNDRTSA